MKRGRKQDDSLPPSRSRDVQRAFRQRRADYISGLEGRVRNLEQENDVLRQRLGEPAQYNKSSPTTLSDSSTPAPESPSTATNIEIDDGETMIGNEGMEKGNGRAQIALVPMAWEAQHRLAVQGNGHLAVGSSPAETAFFSSAGFPGSASAPPAWSLYNRHDLRHPAQYRQEPPLPAHLQRHASLPTLATSYPPFNPVLSTQSGTGYEHSQPPNSPFVTSYRPSPVFPETTQRNSNSPWSPSMTTASTTATVTTTNTSSTTTAQSTQSFMAVPPRGARPGEAWKATEADDALVRTRRLAHRCGIPLADTEVVVFVQGIDEALTHLCPHASLSAHASPLPVPVELKTDPFAAPEPSSTARLLQQFQGVFHGPPVGPRQYPFQTPRAAKHTFMPIQDAWLMLRGTGRARGWGPREVGGLLVWAAAKAGAEPRKQEDRSDDGVFWDWQDGEIGIRSGAVERVLAWVGSLGWMSYARSAGEWELGPEGGWDRPVSAREVNGGAGWQGAASDLTELLPNHAVLE